MSTAGPGVTILGTGSWGTTLAILCARQGARVTLLTRDAPEATQLRADGENRRFLPNHPFPPGLHITHQIVMLHDGSITAEFPADGGTRFVVRLPTVRHSTDPRD